MIGRDFKIKGQFASTFDDSWINLSAINEVEEHGFAKNSCVVTLDHGSKHGIGRDVDDMISILKLIADGVLFADVDELQKRLKP